MSKELNGEVETPIQPEEEGPSWTSGNNEKARMPGSEPDSIAGAVMPMSEGRQSSNVVEEDIPPRLAPMRIFLIGVAMMTTYFLGTASVTGTTIAIPRMAQDLEVTELSVQWVVSAYSLAYGCGLLVSGRLADIYGRKFLFVSGLLAFFIFTILSAVIKSRIPLCVIRALTGLGLAIAAPAVYGIAGKNVRHEPARTLVFAALGLGGPVGASTGTIIGGAVAIASRRGWTYQFYIYAALSLIPLSLGLFVVPRDHRHLENRSLADVDWLGGVLITTAVSLFLFSLTQSGVVENGWSKPYVGAVLGVSIVLVIVFILWERYLEQRCSLPPIVKPSLFSRYNYKVLALSACVILCVESVYGWVYVTTIFYQNVKGQSALMGAVYVLPSNLGGLFVALSVMVLAPRARAPVLIAVGAVLTGIASLLYAVEPENTIYWACEFIACLCLPFGIDYVVGVGSILMSNLVNDDEQSVGGAILQTAAQLGGALGVCLASLISTQRTQSTGSVMNGLRIAGYFNAACSFIVLPIVFVALRKVHLARDVRKSA